jgi:hypothetical protein
MNKKKIFSFFISFIIITMSSIVFFQTQIQIVKADSYPDPSRNFDPTYEFDLDWATDVIWLCSDFQPLESSSSYPDYDQNVAWFFRMTLADVNELNIADIGIVGGDLTDNNKPAEYIAMFTAYGENLSTLMPTNLTDHLPIDDNNWYFGDQSDIKMFHVRGNHDGYSGGAWSTYVTTTNNRVFYYGNIAFISGDATSQGGVNGNWMSTQINANQDKIVVPMSHFPYEKATGEGHLGTRFYWQWTNSNVATSIDTKDVDIFTAGHTHDTHQNYTWNPANDTGPGDGYKNSVYSTVNIVGNTTYLNTGTAGRTGYISNSWPYEGRDPGATESYFLFLRNDSDWAYIYSRNHRYPNSTYMGHDFLWDETHSHYNSYVGTSSWQPEFSAWVQLSKPFESPKTLEPEVDFSFQSINNQTNNTVTYDVITDFNWTKVDNTAYYQLQIANDSAFTDVFVNLTDVNVTNYPGNYTETGGYVEFTLPESYRRQWYQGYYFRIRSFSYYTGE